MKDSQFHFLMGAICVAPINPEKYHWIFAVIAIVNIGLGIVLSYIESKNERRKPRS